MKTFQEIADEFKKLADKRAELVAETQKIEAELLRLEGAARILKELEEKPEEKETKKK